jgi:phage terminase large subunit
MVPAQTDSFFSKPVTPVFTATYNAKEKIVINQGGSRSSKTYSIMQILIVHAILNKNWVITVVGQDVPNLKAGPMRDMESILNNDPHLKKYTRPINNTDRIYRFHNGSVIEFRSYDTPQDAHSGGRDVLFVNEANGIAFGIYRQLAMRTKKKIYIDFNPSQEFWAHTEVWKPIKYDPATKEPYLDGNGKELREIAPNVVLFKSNYRHNPYVPKEIIDEIESYKEKDPEYYKVYGLGEMGVIEGLVYKKVEYIPEWPEEELKYSKIIRGLDFGYSSDPTAMVKLAVKDRCLYVEEEIYARKLKIDPMAEAILRKAGDFPIWCDIDPRLKDELRDRGVNVRQVAKKDKDILAGIAFINSFDKIYCVSSSLNMKKEFNNYKYAKDKNNNDQIMPVDYHNHSMDALRYGAMSEHRVGNTITVELDCDW